MDTIRTQPALTTPALDIPRRTARIVAAAALLLATLGGARAAVAQKLGAAPDPREARGYALLEAGQYKDALGEFERLKADDPMFAPALLGLGRAQEGLGRTKVALKSYEAFVALRPQEAEGFEAMGWVLERMRRHDAALEAFRDAQHINPRSAGAWRGAGAALRSLDRKQEALRSLREAARLDGEDAMTWGELATLSLEMDRDLDAANYWEEALRRDPGYFDARRDERKRWEGVMEIIGPRPLGGAPAVAETPAPSAAPSAAPGATDVASQVQATGQAKPAQSSALFARGPASSGSGFVVARDRGFVLTNKHVVRGCTEVKVRIDGDARSANVRALDPDDDLALLEAPLPAGPTATFRDDPAVRPGDDVVAVGFPLAGLLADQVNVSTGSVNALAGLYNDLHLLQMSAPVQPGSSGGALFDASGNVVGVVVTKLNAKIVAEETGDIPQNVNFAVKGAIAREFLRTQGVSFHSAQSRDRRSNADVGEIGRQVTVLVECWK
jgi:S1-C subfamily serine protease/Flp pilus assembly protein TadD